MNNTRTPVLNLRPPIAKPRKRGSHAHIAKPQGISTPRNLIGNMHSLSPQKGNLHYSGSFSLETYLKDHITSGKSSDDIFLAQVSNKKPFLRKAGGPSIERRRFSIDLSDVSKSADTSENNQKRKKIQHSSSFRKTRYSMDDESYLKDSPLAFNADGNVADKEDEGQVVVIIVNSNWGDPNFLRISSISILDDKFMTVPVIKSTTSPDLGINTKPLFNGHLIKKEINELFTIPWSQDHEPFHIAIVVPSDVTISGVRIFNSKIALESSVKDIILSLDNSNTLSGEIPKNFGIDFKFTQEMRQDAIESSRLIEDYFLENREKSFQDQYGLYPLFSTKTLSFELKKSWTDENVIGLNGIQIYDQYNKLINPNDIDDIIVHHCGSSNDPSLLFKSDLKTSRPERQFLTKTIPGKSPLIEVIFKVNHFLSRIILWNYNSSRDPVEYGVKYIKICSDENLIWFGKIEKSTGNEISADKKIKTIWMTDSVEMKNQVIIDN